MVHSKRHSYGFTLMELMLALIIATLLATIAIPSFNSLIKKNRISIYTNNLVSSLALARSEAVKRGTQISLCASDNGVNCTHTSFQQGWIVFTDQDTAGTVDGNDAVLRVQEAATRLSFTITGNALVQYKPTGVLVVSLSTSGYEWLAEASTPVSFYSYNSLSNIFSGLLPGSQAHASNHMTGNGSPDQGNPLPGEGDETPSDPLRTGITNFDICTTDTTGESGILVVVSITGRISTLNITCS